MAKQVHGPLGGFVGKLGPLIGYRWRGRWCVRTRPQHVHNPQTPLQMERRHAFGEQVRLAARMAWAVDACLTLEARRAHMTSRNLFVRINQGCFRLGHDGLQVDYAHLQLSRGPVAPAEATSVAVDDDGVLHVGFDRNPLHRRCSAHDEVYLYVYSPSAGGGYLFNPVRRHTGRIDAVLPQWLVAGDICIYLMVKDSKDRWSATTSAPAATDTTGTAGHEEEKNFIPKATSINQTFSCPPAAVTPPPPPRRGDKLR